MSSRVNSLFFNPGLCLVIAGDGHQISSRLPEVLPAGHRLEIHFHSGIESAESWLNSRPVGTPPLRLALIDLELTGDAGLLWLRRLSGAGAGFPDCVTLALAGTYENLNAALGAGAAGFLRYEDPPARLAEMLGCIDRGEPPVLPSLALMLLAHFRTPKTRECPDDALTARERELLTLIARGLSATEAVHHLGLSPGLLRESIHTIYRKLGVSNQTFR